MDDTRFVQRLPRCQISGLHVCSHSCEITWMRVMEACFVFWGSCSTSGFRLAHKKGYGGAAQCVGVARFRGRSMWCCSGRCRVCPLSFWPLPDTELLPYVFSSLFLCLYHFCSQELCLCCSLVGCNAVQGSSLCYSFVGRNKKGFIAFSIRHEMYSYMRLLDFVDVLCLWYLFTSAHSLVH